MKIYIYTSNNLYFYKIFFINLFTLLDIDYEFINNYDEYADFVINSKNNIFINNKILYDKFNRNKTIMNNIELNYLLMNKNLLINNKYTPYTFSIDFDDLNYDKKLMKNFINKYHYNKYFGNNLWILKNSKSGRGIGTLLVSTEELLNLENNEEFIKEISQFKNKTSYIIQKYLEKPILYDNKKYDVRVHILLLTKLDKDNNIIYKFYLSKNIILRLSTVNFNLNNLDKKIHLTNMAVQN